MSRNQQGVPGAIGINFGVSFDNRDHFWKTNTQNGWISNNIQPAASYQVNNKYHIVQKFKKKHFIFPHLRHLIEFS